MKTRFAFAFILAGLLVSGCSSPEERVKKEKKDAAKSVGAAEQKEQKVEQKADQRVADSTTVKEQEDAKIKGTKEIAKAKEKVGDEKVDATKDVTDAEVAAGHGGTYQKK